MRENETQETIPNKNIFLAYTSPDREHQQGWGGLAFSCVGREAAARPALAARPEIQHSFS